MLSSEFKKIYHPRMGRYVYRHRGNGLNVDTLMKPLKICSKICICNVVKPFAKRAIKVGVSHAGERVGKAAANKAIEKLGNRLSQMNREQSKGRKGRVSKETAKKTQNDVNMLINNLIARTYKTMTIIYNGI